jgi:hypothetical protein
VEKKKTLKRKKLTDSNWPMNLKKIKIHIPGTFHGAVLEQLIAYFVFPTRLLTSEDEYKWNWHQMIYFPETINTVSTMNTMLSLHSLVSLGPRTLPYRDPEHFAPPLVQVS